MAQRVTAGSLRAAAYSGARKFPPANIYECDRCMLLLAQRAAKRPARCLRLPPLSTASVAPPGSSVEPGDVGYLILIAASFSFSQDLPHSHCAHTAHPLTAG